MIVLMEIFKSVNDIFVDEYNWLKKMFSICDSVQNIDLYFDNDKRKRQPINKNMSSEQRQEIIRS